MTKAMNHSLSIKVAKRKRATALERVELRASTTPRVAPASPTAMAIKVRDPAEQAMIDAFLRGRGQA